MMKMYMIVQVDPTHPARQSQNYKLLSKEDQADKLVYNLNANKWDKFEYHIETWEVDE